MFTFSLSGIKLNDKAVVVSHDGPVVLTPAELTNPAFQPVVTTGDGTPMMAADFAAFEAARYQDTQYRPEGDLYCTTSGDFANPPPPRGMPNSDGQFVPYHYKVAGGPPGAITNPNHINSPDSGIGDTLNASK